MEISPATPTVLPPVDVTNLGFTARWLPLEGASSYEIELRYGDHVVNRHEKIIESTAETSFTFQDLPSGVWIYRVRANLSNDVQTDFSSSAGTRLFPVPFPHAYRSYSYDFDGSDEFDFHGYQAYYLSGPPGNGSIELNTSELSQAYEVLANDRFDLRYLIKNGGNSNERSMGRMRVYFYDRDHQSTLLYSEGSPKDYNFYRKSFSHEVIEDGIIEVKIEELVGDRSAFFDEIEVCISPAPPGVLTASNLRRGGFTANWEVNTNFSSSTIELWYSHMNEPSFVINNLTGNSFEFSDLSSGNWRYRVKGNLEGCQTNDFSAFMSAKVEPLVDHHSYTNYIFRFDDSDNPEFHSKWKLFEQTLTAFPDLLGRIALEGQSLTRAFAVHRGDMISVSCILRNYGGSDDSNGRLRVRLTNEYNEVYELFDGTSLKNGVDQMVQMTEEVDYYGVITVELIETGNERPAYFDDVKVSIQPGGNAVQYLTALRKTQEDLEGLPHSEVSQKINFYDGLGRLKQELEKRISPSTNGIWADLISDYEYDVNNNLVKSYLPFPAPGDDLGESNQRDSFFYRNFGFDNKRFAYFENSYEPSPINRLEKRAAPGYDWRSTGDHTTRFNYLVNTSADNVRKLGIHPVTKLVVDDGYYGVELTKTIIRDENTQDETGQVVEFVNGKGQTVLKQVWLSTTEKANTYYIYDHFGYLRYVIPPGGIKEIVENGHNWGLLNNVSFQKRWMFCYTYDKSGNITGKRVPGSDWSYFVYDQRNRLVLTQDGNQRQNQEWLFTKYDELNRPVATGMYVNGAVTTLAPMQALVHEYYDNLGIGQAWYETRGTGFHGYDNASFPQAIQDENYLSVIYYDDYAFHHASLPAYHYQPTGENAVYFDRVKGQVTGSMKKVLGTDRWLRSAYYYDDRYRLIQEVSDHHKEGVVRTSHAYDFVGKVVKTSTSQYTPSPVLWKNRVEVKEEGGGIQIR